MMYIRNNNGVMNMFDDVFKDVFSKSMPCDITEDEQAYTLVMEACGVKKENIKISFENDYIIVDVKQNEAEDKKNYIVRERELINSRRSFYLPKADTNNVKASLDSGLLTIFVNKKTAENKKYIEIE